MGQKEIVIVGGGIIGCCTAYYISRHPSYVSSTTKVTLMEASYNGIAQGASGKAGGLVAKWAYPKSLVDISFEEHKNLAEEHNGKDRWGWRFVNCGSWEGRGAQSVPDSTASGVGKKKSLEKKLGLDEDSNETVPGNVKLPSDLLWIQESLTDTYSSMAPIGSTAQVHPYLFTTSMLDLAKEKGVTFLPGRVTTINKSGGDISGVSYRRLDNEGNIETIPATHVILCAGAWSSSIVSNLPVSSTRAHSITVQPQPGVDIAPYVLFTEISLPSTSQRGQSVSTEIYARPGNEVYICGPGDDLPLPDTVDDVVVEPEACDSLMYQVSSISKQLKEGTVTKKQACYLPLVTSGSGPIVGDGKKWAKGLYIGTGHTCWGICNAPGTGRILSDMVMSEKSAPITLKNLDPSKFL